MATLEHHRTGTSVCDEGEGDFREGESAGESRAMTLLTAVERSVLRALAFVFYQLERTQAKRLAHAVLRWYFHLQAQLPAYAVASLERVAASVVALSDAQFTSFWLSLLEKEIDATDSNSTSTSTSVDSASLFVSGSSCGGPATACISEPRVTIHIDEASDWGNRSQARGENQNELLQEREKTLAKRLYLHIYGGLRSLFFAKRSHATQTPCTSPVDLSDESHYEPQSHRYRRLFTSEEDAKRPTEGEGGNTSTASTAGRTATREALEPSWAVEYMEQESPVAAELTRRMRRMMHSAVPLNLFRVTVALGGSAACVGGGEDERGFVGVITPESFPPTPITRDLQTRRLHCYTASVLDHTTLALRLIEASRTSGSSSVYLR